MSNVECQSVRHFDFGIWHSALATISALWFACAEGQYGYDQEDAPHDKWGQLVREAYYYRCQLSVVSCQLSFFAASLMEGADRSTSSALVDQLEIEIRMAGSFCQVVPPTQHTPPRCTRAMTPGVTLSPDRDRARTST